MSDHFIYPLTFAPVFRDYIWGGRNLEKLYGRALPPGIVAESWEISGHPSSPTTVLTGPLAGLALPKVQERLGDRLVGARSRWAVDRGRFPLLVKLLDANRPLSVQVHPPDAYALEHEGGELGKAEMWYVLHARPGAELIYGLSRETPPAEFRAALDAGTLPELLHRLPIREGDAILIPTGTVHALLEGVVVTEIQQNSDTTYRVYDWGRLGADGKPRPLHVDKALDVIDWGVVRPGVYEPRVIAEERGVRRSEISRCRYFLVEKLDLEAGATVHGRCDGATFEIWGCVAGRATLSWEGDPLPLCAVQYVLLPAELGDYALRADAAPFSMCCCPPSWAIMRCAPTYRRRCFAPMRPSEGHSRPEKRNCSWYAPGAVLCATRGQTCLAAPAKERPHSARAALCGLVLESGW